MPSLTLRLDIMGTSPYKSYPRFAPYIKKKRGNSGVDIEMIKSDIDQDFSLKSYVVDIYSNRLEEAIRIDIHITSRRF